VPKGTEYAIAWSDTLQGYEVIHTPFRFPLHDTTTLHHWLGMIDTFHFCSPTGHSLTVRKEKKQRGTAYWYAYKRVNGKVQKRYLGDTSKLDLATLEHLARHFVEPVPKAAPKQSPPQPPRQPALVFTRTLESALHIYGFRTVPNLQELTRKYRELSKKHHPDAGGFHLDMVAVNAAYDYLKKFVNNRQ
jgi:hypothetical protein